MLLVVMATSQNSIALELILVIEVLLIATRCGPPT
jgi:hypothetical protein